MANKLNLNVYQGGTFEWEILLTQPTAGSPPVDLTGCHAVMQIRRRTSDPEVLIEASTYNGKIVNTPLNGSLKIIITDEETAELAISEGVYDVLLLWPAGNVDPLYYGSVRVTKGVSREWLTT